MANSPTDLQVRHFTARDGVRLAWRELGEGRPLLLIHGFFSNAFVNWIRFGHAQAIAQRGFCSACGTSLTFEFPDSENMDLLVATFDDPSRFVPKHHFGAESMHRAWLNTEGLPEIETNAYQPLVDRWMKACGKLPD